MSQHDDFDSPIEAKLAAPPSAAAKMDASTLSTAQGSVGSAPSGYGGAEMLIQNKFCGVGLPVSCDRFLGVATAVDESTIQFSRASPMGDCRNNLYARFDRACCRHCTLVLQTDCRMISHHGLRQRSH